EFIQSGKMSAARVQHTAVNLPDGRVLVMGGKAPNVGTSHNTTIHGSAEIYDPATGAWTDTGYMNIERYAMPVGLLKDGRVIAAGGRGVLTYALPDVDIWDPATGEWTVAAPRKTARGPRDWGGGGNARE
ncbi:MAG: kelch repeat-containing protein, partial [Dehalococcoidia bacterium]|nr:kelch repeat-containing protein [Dehalococcoidia bacterium]